MLLKPFGQRAAPISMTQRQLVSPQPCELRFAFIDNSSRRTPPSEASQLCRRQRRRVVDAGAFCHIYVAARVEELWEADDYSDWENLVALRKRAVRAIDRLLAQQPLGSGSE